ncbi:unnamed protein product, partial [Rotaria magnacalcarata]
EQAASVIPIPIEIGHCVAGYVAWSKETVRINNISKLDMQKYPDGIYIKDDQVTTVMAHPIVNTSGTLLGVVEFYRVNSTIPFSDEDVEVSEFCCYTIFMFSIIPLHITMLLTIASEEWYLYIVKIKQQKY